MSTFARPVTAEELFRMPRSNVRRELVRGEVREMAPSGFDHGAVMFTFGTMLRNHVHAHGLGVVVGGETGFRLARNPDTVRGVDVGFVRAARVPGGARTEKYFEGPPDLAVEVVSPDDRPREIDAKVADYLGAGTPMVVVLRPKRRTATIHRPRQKPVVLAESDTLDLGAVVHGFTCRVRDIFV